MVKKREKEKINLSSLIIGITFIIIGLAGVYDYKTFWEELNGSEIVSAYYKVGKYSNLKSYNFDWYDVGTVDNYIKAKNLYKDSTVYSIPKTNGEFLYKVKHNFIKLSSDKDFIKKTHPEAPHYNLSPG